MSPLLLADIDELRKKLVRRAEDVRLNLQHPEVLKLSQQLDELIMKAMRDH
jgi:hypothetical protein